MKMTAFSPLSQVIDDAERSGRLNLHATDIADKLPDLSADALRQALRRLKKKGRIVLASRGSGHWVIVPIQDSVTGAPPLESWLHAYLTTTLNIHYYVGLLSAAEIYGASPYAVMVTQVIVPKPRRSIQVGRHKLEFIVRADLMKIPTQWHETENGRFKISTAEITVLELIQRQSRVGGVGRLIAVLHDLLGCCTSEGLNLALTIIDDVSSAQRLGALLSREGLGGLSEIVQIWLRGKRIRPVIFFESYGSQIIYDSKFKVHIAERLELANT
jgi:predicted transcriptional regulator of viral defense system